jgi:hypothetical protein
LKKALKNAANLRFANCGFGLGMLFIPYVFSRGIILNLSDSSLWNFSYALQSLLPSTAQVSGTIVSTSDKMDVVILFVSRNA